LTVAIHKTNAIQMTKTLTRQRKKHVLKGVHRLYCAITMMGMRSTESGTVSRYVYWHSF